LHIELEPGNQLLSGKDATSYLRFRRDQMGDIGRIARQQKFMRSVTSKVMGSGNLLRSPKLLKRMLKMVDTDLSFRQMLGFASQFGEAFTEGRFQSGSVPGAITLIDGVSYWRPDISAMDVVIDEILFGFAPKVASSPVLVRIPKKDLIKVAPLKKTIVAVPVEKVVVPAPIAIAPTSHVQVAVTPSEDRRLATVKEISRIAEQTNLTGKTAKKLAKSELSIEILNGVGQDGLATKFANVLSANGYKIVRVDNSKNFDYHESKMVDWKDNLQTVLVMAGELGIDPKNIIIYDRPAKPLDVTLVIGGDWESVLSRLSTSSHPTKDSVISE
jgi:polyisoprenyl-teichoic acid--peptidoglycan teichoic acid transferase